MKRNVKSLKNEYETAVNQASVVAFIAVARRHPDITISELSELAGEYGLEGLTVKRMFVDEDFMDFKVPKELKGAGPGKAKKETSKEKRKSKKNGARKPKKLSLRTVPQREAYRLLVLDSNTDEWQSSPEIQAQVGGDAGQVLRTLNSLIEEDLVEFKGQARGTRYKLTKRGRKAKGK